MPLVHGLRKRWCAETQSGVDGDEHGSETADELSSQHHQLSIIARMECVIG